MEMLTHAREANMQFRRRYRAKIKRHGVAAEQIVSLDEMFWVSCMLLQLHWMGADVADWFVQDDRASNKTRALVRKGYRSKGYVTFFRLDDNQGYLGLYKLCGDFKSFVAAHVCDTASNVVLQRCGLPKTTTNPTAERATQQLHNSHTRG